MARKKAKKEFKPWDKVIWFRPDGFDPREPVIAWVPSEKLYPAVMDDRVRVTRHEKDVQSGVGMLDSMEYVYPFSAEFWYHCSDWMNHKAKLGADLKKLQKGKY